MKLNKSVIMIMIILSILTISVVSATNTTHEIDSDSYPIDEIGYDKVMYVDTNGDDLNNGSSENPYKTISRAISSNELSSDNTIIYLSEGTFSGEKNCNLTVEYNHVMFGGSLTFAGAGNNKTIIDGKGNSIFANFNQNTKIKLINLTFVNCGGQYTDDEYIHATSAITAHNLEINNCTFKEIDYTYDNYPFYYNWNDQPIIKATNLNLTNSQFTNCEARTLIDSPNANINNNKFIGNTTLLTVSGNINNNTFINTKNASKQFIINIDISYDQYMNITNNIFINKYINTENAIASYNSRLFTCINNTFINSSSILFRYEPVNIKNNKFYSNDTQIKGKINLDYTSIPNPIIKFQDAILDQNNYKVYATAEDDQGNILNGQGITFILNNETIGEAATNNGIATVTLQKVIPNGEYTLTGTSGNNPKVYDGKVIINFYIVNIVTPDNFFEYFDSNGNLRSDINVHELIFRNNFNGLVKSLNINSAIKLTGEDAVLNNMLININSKNVIIEGFVINITEDYLKSNNLLKLDGDDSEYVILATSCDNLQLINNHIIIAGKSTSGVKIFNSSDVLIKDNIIDSEVLEDDIVYLGITIDSSNNLILDANKINIDTLSDSIGINLVNSDNSTVRNNSMNVKGDNVYSIYSDSDNSNFENNIISSRGSLVYGVYLIGRSDILNNNKLIIDGNSVIGVYSASDLLTLSNNNINVNGSDDDTTGVKLVKGTVSITNNEITSNTANAIETADNVKVYSSNNTLDYNNTSENNNTTEDTNTTNNNTSENNTTENNNNTGDNTTNNNNTDDNNKTDDSNIITTVIDSQDVEMYYHDGTRFRIVLKDSEGNLLTNQNVTITINGVSYTKPTNANGAASIPLNLNSGKYTVSIVYNGSGNYSSINATNTVNILKTIDCIDLVKVFMNASQYHASFVDKKGNPLNKTGITFNINGVMYERNTNANGTARLNIKLNPGEYIITAINPVTGEMQTGHVKVLSNIINNTDLVKYYRNGSRYQVTVVGLDGKVVGAGEKVSFNINGVLYTRNTNANGVASLNINLGEGKYIITAEYKGNRVSNNITVLSLLSAKDLVMSYMDGSQFVVKLVDKTGKDYAKQTVRFNINGVFYDRVTNATGYAKLNIKLMAGEYIITSTYEGCNIANKVTVK